MVYVVPFLAAIVLIGSLPAFADRAEVEVSPYPVYSNRAAIYRGDYGYQPLNYKNYYSYPYAATYYYYYYDYR